VDIPDSFYLSMPDGSFESTPATESPWDSTQQHGGPPSALLLRAIDLCEPRPDMTIGRVSIDFLGAIPQGRMTITAGIERSGRRIELVEARLEIEHRCVAVARAWRLQTGGSPTRPDAGRAPEHPLPEPQVQHYFDGVDPAWGYGRAIEWRFAHGGYAERGPAMVWARPRIGLVAGEASSPLQRTLLVADSINGLSAELDLAQWLFIPPALTVTVHREPRGPWLLLDAHTAIGGTGLGMSQATLSDQDGEFGVATQPLLVQPRQATT
jgi:hypothetical protein